MFYNIRGIGLFWLLMSLERLILVKLFFYLLTVLWLEKIEKPDGNKSILAISLILLS